MDQSAAISTPAVSIVAKVQVRASLLQWAFDSDKSLAGAGDKKISVVRKNRYTHLAEKYESERKDQYRSTERLRLLDIWCRLRGYGEGHIIRDYKSKLKLLASFCDCGVTKLKEYIKKLAAMGWIYSDNTCIAITSEEKVYGLCGIEFKRKVDTIFVKPDKIKDEKQKHYWLFVASISDNRARQAYSFTKNVDTSEIETKIWIKSYLHRRGYDADRVLQTPAQLTAIMKALYIESFVKSKEDEIHEFLVENRPDVNRSVYGMAEAWNLTPQTVSDIKKQIRNRELATINKIGTISSGHWARNAACHRITKDGIERVKGALWNRKTSETFQAICDDIVPRVPEVPQMLLQEQGMPDFRQLVREALDGRAAA